MKWGEYMKFYTVIEVADVLRVSESTIQSWVRAGKLKASKLGGTKTIRIRESDLIAFVDESKIKVD